MTTSQRCGSCRSDERDARQAGAQVSEVAPTRRDRIATPTRRDAAPAAPRSIYSLPSALACNWQIVRALAARGAEADLFVVARHDDSEQAVAKLYRPGIRPPAAALERVKTLLAAHAVRVFEYGESDGVPYELMEYCVHGSLRERMAPASGDTGFALAVLAQLAPALEHLHAAGLIHRDLKPENVLVRALEPLQLVLADFGIASLAVGTNHFTSTSRTVRYAPPEAMSGVLSTKADYWSLGMILAELLLGRHPFEGLSEAVINHQLIVRAVDIGAIADPAWRGVVRGLLLRDPQARFGGEELRRWLARDPTLDLDRADNAIGADLRPYEIEGTRATSAQELGIVLVRHWQAGTKDLARGLVLDWVRNELRDQNLARFVHDLTDLVATPEQRLLRLALHVAPGMPSVWRARPLTSEMLQHAVAQALAGDAHAEEWLLSLHRAEACRLYADAGHPDGPRLAALEKRWQARITRYRAAEERLATARRELLEADAKARRNDAKQFANFDELVFGRATQPEPSALPNALLLAADYAIDAIDSARRQVVAITAELADDCAWFGALGDPATLEIEAIAALLAATPAARDYAERRRAALDTTRKRARAEAVRVRALLDTLLATLRPHELGAEPIASSETRFALREAEAGYRSLYDEVANIDSTDPSIEEVRMTLRRMQRPFERIGEGLDQLEHFERVNEIWFVNGRGFAAGIVVLLLVLRLWPVVVVAALLVGGAIGWQFWRRARAVEAIKRALERLPPRVTSPADA